MEVLEISADVLRGIQIPVELAEQVGKPVLGVISNLRLCADALRRAEDAGAAEEGPSPAAAGAPQQAGEPGEPETTEGGADG